VSLSAIEVLGALVRGGLGAASCAAAVDGGLWLPAWLVAEAERRAATPVAVAGRRWSIPRAWPVPVEQALVARMPDAAAVARVLAATAMPDAEPCLDATYPPSWLVRAPAIDDAPRLMRLIRLDGHLGVRHLLAGGAPLSGCAVVIAWFARRSAVAAGAAWTGRVVDGLPLALAGDGIALLPGWLQALLVAAGLDHPGAPVDATAATERHLIIAAGGRVIGAGDDELHRLPRHVAGPLRALPLDWTRVPALGAVETSA